MTDPASSRRRELVRARGSAKIGIANELAYSFAHPDVTVDGVEPGIPQAVRKRLGVGKVEAIVGTFASMIPSLQAGKTDMVCTVLREATTPGKAAR
jgi:polar amino acid transport system substrate-binding protein